MDSENDRIPAELAPVGGWNNNPPAPQTVAAPAVAEAKPTAPKPGVPPLAAPPTAFESGSRFSTPPPASVPTATPGSRFAAPSPLPPPAAPAPAATLAPPPPEPERAYSLAGAYRRGQIEEVGTGKIVAAIVAGSVVAAVMTTIWMILYFLLAMWFLVLLGGAMGYLVGFTVFKVTGEGEEKSCWISCIISTVFALGGALTINIVSFMAFGFPNIWALAIGAGAVYLAYDKGYHTPETLAVETSA